MTAVQPAKNADSPPKRTQGKNQSADRSDVRQWMRACGFACQTTLGLAVLSGLLQAIAFPPIGFAAAIWFAPLGLVLLIRRADLSGGASLGGKRPYFTLWCAGFLSWALLLHWLRLPHWAGYFS